METVKPTSRGPVHHFEATVLTYMTLDGWDEVPQTGEKLDTALSKVLNYINWLRDGKPAR